MNAKHQFKYTYNEGCEEFSPCDVTFDMPGDVTITQMLWNFECYLKACGFVFDGHLEVVEESYDLKDIYEDWINNDTSCCSSVTDCCGKDYTPTPEVKKNNWVQGICNPPAKDWKTTNNDHYDGAASANPKEYSKWLNKNK